MSIVDKPKFKIAVSSDSVFVNTDYINSGALLTDGTLSSYAKVTNDRINDNEAYIYDVEKELNKVKKQINRKHRRIKRRKYIRGLYRDC